MLHRYFQDELAYLRDLGREFASAYPDLAPMLADRGADPDVERLLEGVAFLTAKVRQKLDDEMPEAIHGIASLLFPQLLRPQPSATILELTPLSNVLREKVTLPAGAEFGSIPVSGTTCRFRCSSKLELVPWEVDGARLESLPGGYQELRVDLRTAAAASGPMPEVLKFHLAGEPRDALALLVWLFQETEDVVLMDPRAMGDASSEVSLSKDALVQVGFEDEEALFPFAENAFPGFRLLQEYYMLPQKFAFFGVRGLGRVSEFGKVDRFSIAFRMKRPIVRAPVTRDSVRTNCVGVLNIFEAAAEPLRLNQARERYTLRVSGLTPDHSELYAITRVQTIPRGSTQRVEIPNFYDFSHTGRGKMFYTPHYTPSTVGDGCDLSVSFGTAEDSGVLPDADFVSVDVMATNRNLAGALRPGEVRVPTLSSPSVVSFKNLVATTQRVPSPMGRDLHWRVIAHAAMGLRSLAEPRILRALLDVYNLQATIDRQASRANELRVAAISGVTVKPSERLFRGAPVRGVQLEVQVDEQGFAGDGDIFVFGAILDRLFSHYVSLNSFSKTAISGTNSKVRYAWPARSGSQILL